jgi:hypothetical protein
MTTKFQKALIAGDDNAAATALGLQPGYWSIAYAAYSFDVEGVHIEKDDRVLVQDGGDVFYLAHPDLNDREVVVSARKIVLRTDVLLDYEPTTFFALRYMDDKSFFKSLRKGQVFTVDDRENARRFKTADDAEKFAVDKGLNDPIDGGLRIVKVTTETMDVDGTIRNVRTI